MLSKKYERIEQELIKRLADMEDIHGTIRISPQGKSVRYYHHWDGYEKSEKYILKKDIDLAKLVAQKNYYEKLLVLVRKRQREINRLIGFDEFEVDYAYDQMQPFRKMLITPIEKTIDQKYEEWLNSEYTGKEFQEGDLVIHSEKGERVRSKSERSIADYLYHNNIYYKYEKPLVLKGAGIVYPDFTFFSKKLGKEIYWEHDGRMDDEKYARNAVRKLDSYENNGIYVGERLIVTYETSEKVLSLKEIERNVQRFLN